jgi:hypothetical protein
MQVLFVVVNQATNTVNPTSQPASDAKPSAAPASKAKAKNKEAKTPAGDDASG